MKFAIYGFFFNREFSFNDIKFTPLKSKLSFWENVNRTKDQYNYRLSGFIETLNNDLRNFIFLMQAVLTFVQQQDVIVKEITTEPVADFYPCEFIRRGSAAPFAMYSDLLEEIVKKLYLKLKNENDLCNQKLNHTVFNATSNSEFKSLVYKVIEPFHMRNNFIEITYFLYFSGLEAFCKQYLKSFFSIIYIEKLKAPHIISNTLEQLEINYVNVFSASTTHNLKNSNLSTSDFLKMSITTYSRLRNSLFHANKFVAEVENSSIKVKQNCYPKQLVKITDYEFYLLRLCNAVILKYINIENPNLNCNKWFTRMPMLK